MSVPHVSRNVILIAASGVIGFFGLSSIPRLATLILAVPVLWGMASTRGAAFAVMLAYFLAVSRGLLPGAAVFLSEDHSLVQVAALYLFMSVGVTMPFLVFWSNDGKKKALYLPIAFIVAFALPPISLIGIVNPILAAGTIFKGFGYLGMIFVLLIWILCALEKKFILPVLCVIVAFTVLPSASWFETKPPDGFLAVETSFGKLGSGSYSFEQDYERVRYVFTDLRERNLKNAESKFIVLPETIAGRFNPSALDLWRRELGKLVKDDATVIFGGEIPTDGGKKYDNMVIMLHKGKVSVVPQRIPVPYSMYRGPFAESGANLHLFEDGILELLDGRRAAVFVCYEAYLTWPYLLSMRHRPNMIISIANLWWCRETSLPKTQRVTVALWGLLFGVPVIFATNL